MSRSWVGGLMALTLVALGFRAHRLGAVGFSEDEARKVQAARAYLAGQFIVNTEHPMLMKSLIAGSLVAAERWNAAIARRAPSLSISEEAAVRFPNAVFGALTTIPLFLFACEMFTPAVGWVTAILWATGLNAIAINRIAKEDTLLVFFLWLGYFFFMKAKHEGPSETPRREWLYALSGASFGLMLASKYFPHFMGLIFLYNYLRPHDRQTNYPLGQRAMTAFFVAFFLTFALANPVLFHPATLQLLGVYLTEAKAPHHGYEMMGQLYYNNAWIFTRRTPFYFYFLFLLVKVPPPVILAFLIGVILILRRRFFRESVPAGAVGAMAGVPLLWVLLSDPASPDLKSVTARIFVLTSLSLLLGVVLVVRGRREEGPFFLRFMLTFWFIPFTLFGGKWLRYTLSLMPFVYLTAAVGVSVLLTSLRERVDSGWRRSALAAGVGILFLGVPAATAVAQSPYSLLYVNALGGGEGRRAFYFPHDEIYDAGLREALRFLADRAPQGSLIVQDAPSVVAVYAQKFQRPDLVSVELSRPDVDLAQGMKTIDGGHPVYVIVQRGRRYFENEARLQWLEQYFRPLTEIMVTGIVTTRVYEIARPF